MHEATGKQAAMSTKEHEEYVRSRWERVDCIGSEGSRFVSINGSLWMVPGNWQCDDDAWSAAYAFTLEREEQIRQISQEIALIALAAADVRADLDSALGREQVTASRIFARDAATWQRILAREQAALAELRKGMRQ